jgi:RimJ/RimL family protein N-acetyltransferase
VSIIATPLTTARLVIDVLTAHDAPAVAAYRSDPGVARYQGWTAPYALEQAVALAGSGQLALRHDGALVGDAMVTGVAGSPHAVELGITLAPAAQGKGLAEEAVVGLVDAAFAGGMVKAIAYVDARNAPSLRLFDRVGFRREGFLHHSHQSSEGLVDEVLFGLTADRWRRPTGAPEVQLDPHPADVARVFAELYVADVAAVGVDDGHGLAVLDRDELGRLAGGAVGVAWAGGAELQGLWVRADRRGEGRGRRLVQTFEGAARAQGARRIFLTSFDFQAPGLYRRLGYEETGVREGWPAGHRDHCFQKDL